MKFILLANHNFRGDIPSTIDEAAEGFGKLIQGKDSISFDCFTFLGYARLGGAVTVQKRAEKQSFVWRGSNYNALKRSLGSKECHVFVRAGTLDFDELRQDLILGQTKITRFSSSATPRQIIKIMSKLLS